MARKQYNMNSKQFALIGAQIKKHQEEINRRALLAASRRIYFRTPVDTGEARTGWSFGVGGEGKPSEEDTLNSIKIAIEPMKVGQLGFFINRVGHIIPLEYGHSKQAPSGMVRLTVAQWDSIVVKAAREVK